MGLILAQPAMLPCSVPQHGAHLPPTTAAAAAAAAAATAATAAAPTPLYPQHPPQPRAPIPRARGQGARLGVPGQGEHLPRVPRQHRDVRGGGLHRGEAQCPTRTLGCPPTTPRLAHGAAQPAHVGGQHGEGLIAHALRPILLQVRLNLHVLQALLKEADQGPGGHLCVRHHAAGYQALVGKGKGTVRKSRLCQVAVNQKVYLWGHVGGAGAGQGSQEGVKCGGCG